MVRKRWVPLSFPKSAQRWIVNVKTLRVQGLHVATADFHASSLHPKVHFEQELVAISLSTLLVTRSLARPLTLLFPTSSFMGISSSISSIFDPPSLDLDPILSRRRPHAIRAHGVVSSTVIAAQLQLANGRGDGRQWKG